MDLQAARFLTSDRGRRLLEVARSTRGTPPHQRATLLRREMAADEARLVLVQDDLRVRAHDRCPHADLLLFTADALEQASAWPVAAERATRWPGAPTSPLVDLGAGVGFDALATALAGRPVTAYEVDPVRALLLAANAEALGVAARLTVRQADVLAATPAGPLAYLDPGRRRGGRRTRDPEHFAPPRSTWEGLCAPFKASLWKLPPVELASQPPAGAFEVVSLAGRARERRIFHGDFGPQPPRRALALPSEAAVAGRGIAWPAARAPSAGDWLLDPDPAVTLAGLVGDLAAEQDLRPTHPRIAYLLGAPTRTPTPVPGRWLRIDAVLRPRARDVDAWLRAHEVGRLTIRTRGVHDPVEVWRRRLHPRGHRAGTLVFTRSPDDKWRALAGFETDPAGRGSDRVTVE